MPSLNVSPEVAAAELLRRRRARKSLLDYTKAIEVPGKPVTEDDDEWIFEPVETGLASHHLLILSVMQKIITGAIPRGMFFLPPGSAKSTYGSVVSPTWAMGKYPGLKLILASYGSDLSRRHGRRARQIVKSTDYQDIFGTKLSADTAAADEWALTNGSEYVACGMLSGITGHRAHGIIIDDPIKGRQEADSETVRARTWDVYQEDLRTRLVPGGWEIIIQTRWHEDDLSGRLLPENYEGQSGLIRCRDGRDWYIVCLQAQAERADDPIGRKIGEYLWPEWFSEAHFTPFKQQPRTWNALFQQRPQPDQGTFFQRQWFKRFRQGEEPNYLHFYGSSDYATGDGEGDFTVHTVFGIDPYGDIWIMDLWRKQTESDKWITSQNDLVKRWKPFCWFEEAGAIKKAVKPFQEVMAREAEAYCRHEWLPSVQDKVIRARGFQARAAMGKVHILLGETGDIILDELVRFPLARQDDIVDTCSLLSRALDQAHPAIVPFKAQDKSIAQRHIEMVENTVRQEAAFERIAVRDHAQDRAFWEKIQEGRDMITHDLDGY